MKDSIESRLAEWMAISAAATRREKQEREYKAMYRLWQRMERLKAATTFTITISRMENSVKVATGIEKFEVEGYANAKRVFDAYANRETGYLLKIHRIRMKAGDETVHSMLFNY